MAFPACDIRSDPKRRTKLVGLYNIVPVAHTILLSGQKMEGCCGPILTECFTFSYQLKADPQESGLFSVGKHCGDDFISLTGTTAPPCFNPHVSPAGKGTTGKSGTPVGPPLMCKINQEMYQAINLLLLSWGPPKKALQGILSSLASKPSTPVATNEVLHLNSIIGKDKQQRTLSMMIVELKTAHPFLGASLFPKLAQC
jgi:hypothetical protein